jgi:Tc toxin complex TcA C-terminal TcB-binding domain
MQSEPQSDRETKTADQAPSFIQFGYWDSLKKGLLAGERLSLDLKRMEAFLDDNRRDFEISRQVSLVLHDPMALITLKETGHCEIDIPEALFDMDYPGHYLRRLKSASLTIPCVVGPYTSVNCTLTLMSSKVRVSSQASDYAHPTDAEVSSNFGAIQSIVTSGAQNDVGMFELNFHDERYLPFEGSGAVSHWRIDLPKDTNAFDTDTVSDVILRLSYTARDGGAPLAAKARAAAVMPPSRAQTLAAADPAFPAQSGLKRLFSMRHEFPTEWSRFIAPIQPGSPQSLLFQVAEDRFPFRSRGKSLTIGGASIYFQTKKDLPATFNFNVRADGGAVVFAALKAAADPVLGVPYTPLASSPVSGLAGWRIEPASPLTADLLQDIWIVLDYSSP